jgi:hypothetical protein
VALLYVLEVLCFKKGCKGNLKPNVVIHDHNTRSKYDLHTHFLIQRCSIISEKYVNTGIKFVQTLALED